MSKQRFKTVSTSALTSKKLAKLDATDERLFWRIHWASDSYGTMSGDPWDVAQVAVPSVKGYDLDVVAKGIDTLVGVKLLERWQEADEAWWIHVIDHDRHQSGYFRGKRGARHSPIPPSQRKSSAVTTEQAEPTGAKGSEGESSASEAKVSATEPARYPLVVGKGVGKGEGKGEEIGNPTTGLAREAAAGSPVADLPPSPRSYEARIRQAHRDLAPDAVFVARMIARRNGASHRMLTAAEEFDRFWRPSCDLLHEHGRERLHMALSAAEKAKATGIQYATTACENALAAAVQATSTNPDVGTGDWDHLTPKAS